MSVGNIVLALLTAGAGVHYDRVYSADAKYCFDFREEAPVLLLVKQNDITVQSTEMCDPADCSHDYKSIDTEIDFIDTSGKRIARFWGGYSLMHLHSACYFGPPDMIIERTYKTVAKAVKIELPSRNLPWLGIAERLPEVPKKLLRFRGGVIDGRLKVKSECEPYYNDTHDLKFRAKIAGECSAAFLKKYDRDRRR